MYARADVQNVGLWRADLSGGAPRLLIGNSIEARPRCSPDGEWMVYSERWSPAYQIPTKGGTQQVLIPDSVLSPVVSWDNWWIAAYRTKRDSTGQAPREIAIFPRTGGPAVRTLPLPPAEFDWTPLRWTRDSTAIGYIESHGGVANLWLQPVDGSPPRQLTHFQGGRVIDFDWSPDGQLALEVGTIVRDMFLVRDKGK